MPRKGVTLPTDEASRAPCQNLVPDEGGASQVTDGAGGHRARRGRGASAAGSLRIRCTPDEAWFWTPEWQVESVRGRRRSPKAQVSCSTARTSHRPPRERVAGSRTEIAAHRELARFLRDWRDLASEQRAAFLRVLPLFVAGLASQSSRLSRA